MDRILQFVPAQIKLNYTVPRHPANPREVAGLAGASLRVTGHWGGACPRAGILVNGRVSDFMSVQGWTVFPTFWIVGGQTCWTDK